MTGSGDIPSQGAELTALGLSDASRLLRSRALSPVELTAAYLERIERLDPRLNAFITITAELALSQARTAEAELTRGAVRGPLHGIPVALKDLIDTAGVRTTSGSALYADRVPTRDAEVAGRLLAGGAVLLGKLNLHELAYGASSVIGHFGPVLNPWDSGRTAGGSSAGSAVAVAAQLCCGAVGTDTGGSIRQPAAFCGIVGFKPTYGRVSLRGVMPLAPTYDHVGPMARSVKDVALMLRVMAGRGRGNPPRIGPEDLEYGAAAPWMQRGVEKPNRRLRLGIPRTHFFEEMDPEISAAVEAALVVLAELTEDQRDVAVPAVTDTTVFRAEAWGVHREAVARSPELFEPETLDRLLAGQEIDPATYEEARRVVGELRSGVASVFRDVDLLVTPATVVPPFEVADPPTDTPDLRARELVTLRNTRPFNVLGLPTIALPCGFTAGGLPIGMQITGAPGAEDAVLELAYAYEVATDWLRSPPA